jgi:hypothetical protein
MLVLSLLYIGLCSLVGYLGRDRKFGFWGYLLASLLLDPIIGFLLVLASDRRAPAVTAPVAPAAPAAQ